MDVSAFPAYICTTSRIRNQSSPLPIFNLLSSSSTICSVSLSLFIVFPDLNLGSERRGSDPSMAAKDGALNPMIYDWFSRERLLWPSLSCRWAGLINEDDNKRYHHIYFTEQVEGNGPHTLLFAECEVAQQNVTSMAQISKVVSESTLHMKRIKTIIHPGEVNKIREFPQFSNIVATHTDSPDVFVWDVNQQNDRVVSKSAKDSVPNLILKGHKDNAEYALAMSPNGPFVLSGGKDKSVILWNIEDHISGSAMKSISATEVQPRGVFQGHQNTVEAVQFNPNCSQEFCSVGDDSYLITWDVRTGTKPINKIKAQDGELFCVDWNKKDDNLILTGSSDKKVWIIDRRVCQPVYKFESHDAAVLSVQWCPDKGSVFGSSDENGKIKIWDYEKVDKILETREYKSAGDGLVFEHVGHSGNMVHDFHWNPHDPWTVVSVSNHERGGGNLQIWRMFDLLYLTEQEALAQLESVKGRNIGTNKARKV